MGGTCNIFNRTGLQQCFSRPYGVATGPNLNDASINVYIHRGNILEKGGELDDINSGFQLCCSCFE